MAPKVPQGFDRTKYEYLGLEPSSVEQGLSLDSTRLIHANCPTAHSQIGKKLVFDCAGS